MARNWRASSKRRCLKLGREIPLPSIDEVHDYLAAQTLVCEYCGLPLGTSKKTRPNLDHRLPIARGGTAETSNLAIACGICNRVKGEMDEPEFRALRSLVAGWSDGGKNLFIRLRLGFF